MPVLDEPILPMDVERQTKLLKSNKASGPDGLPPGILKILPEQWILLLATLFNNIFYSATYPLDWTKAKLVTIYKKGDKENVRNYRGISIINSIAKLYDMVLCWRLKQWFKPYREQAGAQEKRGCLEHIVSLRILCDMAKRKRLKLFVTFIDFSQAYDRVPRHTLFRVLQRLGCSAVMLSALVAMYTVTKSVIGTTLVLITLGVRQGSPTSCLLFIILVDDLIRIIKEGCDNDGFLQWLHVLVLMDDTVLLSTSRNNMLRKLRLMKDYCRDYGMEINQSKTKFFVINGKEGDFEPLVVNELSVDYCSQYVYLGSLFTSDGSISAAVRAHANAKMPHVLKFVSFINKNNDIPFFVKKRVFEAALMSSLVYGCESWLGADLKPMIKLYNWCIKKLLGVRKFTCNDVCYIESGFLPLPDIVKHKQHSFLNAMWQERYNYNDDPLMHVLKLVINSSHVTSRLVREMTTNNVPDLTTAMHNLKENLATSISSRRTTYKMINPDLSLHYVYKDRHAINEFHGLSLTKFRVSGHSLVCETGRWNRRGRGRLPLEERLCPCGAVQTEQHVVEQCPLTYNIRQCYDFFSNTRLIF